MREIIEAVEKRFDIVIPDELEDFSDEILGATKVVKVLGCAASVYRKRKFKNFLRGLNQHVSSNQSQKLGRYIRNKKTADYLVNLIEKMLDTVSYKASYIQGVYVSIILDKNEELEYTDISILSFLNDATDYDIDNLIKIGDFIKSKNEDYKSASFGMEYVSKAIDVDLIEMLPLHEKCIKYSLLTREYETDPDIRVIQEGGLFGGPLDVESNIPVYEFSYSTKIFWELYNVISNSNLMTIE